MVQHKNSTRKKPAPGCWCGGACPHMAPVAELERAKRPRQAEGAIRRRLVLAPDCPELHKALARYLEHKNRAHDAGAHLALAGLIEGETPALALRIAHNARMQARFPYAIEAAGRAVALAPGDVFAHVALCYAMHASGESEHARGELERGETKFRGNPALRRIRALIAADFREWREAIAILAGDDLTPIELLDRGRYREKLQDYAGAWSDWMEAKRLQREAEKLVYRPELFERQIAELMDSSRPPRVDALRRASFLPSPAPLFITGYPRSGTTMIEASLSAHPLIVAGDEMPCLPELTQKLPFYLNAPGVPYPRCLQAFAWPENYGAANFAALVYFEAARARINFLAKDELPRFFTDKMASNVLHWPLMAALFPKSRIVHVSRHPLDVLTSCMSQFLVHGGHSACSLEWAAHHYSLTDKLAAHYRKACPPPELKEIAYEQFVADTGLADSLLPAGLEPDQACHQFHLNPWQSRTLSYRQIKEPAHDKSIGRFRPFLEFFKPVLPALAAALERGGYSID